MENFDTLFRLDGRVALVVGAASGIGRAAALGLASAGAVTICADLNQTGAEAVADEIRSRGGQAEASAVDITDEPSVAGAVRQILDKHRSIDVLVSTPAVNVRKPLLRYSAEEFEKVIRLNLKGNFLIAQAVGRAMSENKRGSIILLSSIRSLVVEPGQGVYAATKAGLVQLARTFAAELGSAGVRVNCIAPGVVETPLTEPIKKNAEWYNAYASKNALGRWASAEEMVGPVIFLASDASSYVTGAVLFVDGGWTAVDGRFTPPL
ncbi:MAG TPA: SDR family NAD(P)-dependent oxidoreductase [Bryobacteraceae bacterium]|nr:SDR family NAD(P)-dependent oxidoreductase [Bryobacteraceae bacterium]